MKHRFLLLALISAATAGCTETVVEDASYYLDAVHRVADPQTYPNSPFGYMARGWIFKKFSHQLGFYNSGISVDSLEHGQTFDIAVGLFRAQKTNGSASLTEVPIGRVAFEAHNAPAQVGNVSLNNETLPWLSTPSAIGTDYSYAKADLNLDISQDNLTFAYVDFNSESHNDKVSITPNFGTITFPDTISLSHGCSITYQHSVPNDSVQVHVDVFDSSFLLIKPDTGEIVFGPDELPPDHTYSNAGLMISFYRWSWSTRTSPSGKKIGVYSSMETEPIFIPYKP